MNFRNLLMWGLIVLLSVGLFNLFQNPNKPDLQSEKIAFSKFLEEVDTGRVVEVTIQGNNINGTLSDDKFPNQLYFEILLEGELMYQESLISYSQKDLRKLLDRGVHIPD